MKLVNISTKIPLQMKIVLFIFVVFAHSFGAFGSEPSNWQLGFQKSATHIMDEVIWLYDFVMYILLGVVVVVLGLLVYVCFRFNSKRNPIPAKFDNNITIEVIWTLIPLFLLLIMAIPSFGLLKKIQTVPKSDITIKVVGRQWYWSYSYPDNGNFGFDSYMIQDTDLKPNQKRLLEVDNRIIVPIDSVVRFIITASDVIHSFAIPSAGIKTDAVPGRINETWVKFRDIGVYYGQCSELCGANHGFMPIAIEVVSKDDFEKWVGFAHKKFSSNNPQNVFANNN